MLAWQGTTGETLACMTQSLMGLDHKVHIILNKGNLSKVIPGKDLPRFVASLLGSSHIPYRARIRLFRPVRVTRVAAMLVRLVFLTTVSFACSRLNGLFFSSSAIGSSVSAMITHKLM